ALGERIADEIAEPRPQRGSDREITRTPRTPYKQQPGNIRACDQQHETDRPPKDEDGLLQIAGGKLGQRNNEHAPLSRFAKRTLRIVVDIPLSKNAHEIRSALESHAGPGASNYKIAFVVAILHSIARGRQSERQPDISFRGPTEVRGHHSRNAVWRVV